MNKKPEIDTSTQSHSNSFFTQIINCAKAYDNMKNRLTHPKGKFDSASRFYVDKKFACCEQIRSPSRSYPYSQMTHARSLEHIAHEFSLERHISVIRKIANTLSKKGEDEAINRLNSNKIKSELLTVSIGL